MDAFTAGNAVGGSTEREGTAVAYKGLKPDLISAQDWPVLYQIMKGCLESNPAARPTFEVIHSRIQNEK